MKDTISDQKKKVCIVSPGRPSYSETFIRAHLDYLPTDTCVLFGRSLGDLRDDKDRMVKSKQVFWSRIDSSVRRHFLREDWESVLVYRIANYLSVNRIDVVLAEYGPTGVLMMEPCRRSGVPLTVHFHGYDAYEKETVARMGAHYRRLFEFASATIAVSRDMEDQLVGLGAPREKVHYNPYGVNLSHFEQANPATAAPIFLAVGRFVDKKAPDLTLLAFRRVLQQVPQARLFMVGDGPLLAVCQRLASALGICYAVCFMGSQGHAEVAQLMRGKRAFVQHSVRSPNGDMEGTPVAILEASASGLPVVATRHGGIVDVVKEGKTGLLVNEHDIDGMAHAMTNLARDPELASRLGDAARKHIASNYTMDSHIERLSDVLYSTTDSKLVRSHATR